MPAPLYLLPAPLASPKGRPSPEQQAALAHTTYPPTVLQQAAALTHWACESEKGARRTLATLYAGLGLSPEDKRTRQEALQLHPLPNNDAPLPASYTQPLLKLLQSGTPLGLLSDAGLPALADAGARLVRAVQLAQLPVLPLGGASSISLAVACSGLGGQHWAFVGYLPVEAKARSTTLRQLEARAYQEQQAQFFIETPYRAQQLFQAALGALQPATLLHLSIDLTLPTAATHTLPRERWAQQPAPQLHKRLVVFGIGAP